MVEKNQFFSEDDPKKNKYNYGTPPADRGKDRSKFTFGSSKFADWSEGELWDYLKFLNNPPKPEDLEERPDGGYRP